MDPLFEERFKCLPFSKYENPLLESGDKIIIPPSFLKRLEYSGLKEPFQFNIESQINNNNDQTVTSPSSHCGVLPEHKAKAGSIYMPEWMMKNLKLQEEDNLILRNAPNLPKGKYVKLQPHANSPLLPVPNPKAFLEKALWNFSCLSKGDTIMIKHDEKEFYLDIVKVRPGVAISLIGTYCEVDFVVPVDYKEPEKVVFRPFEGKVRVLDSEPGRGGRGGYSDVVKTNLSKLEIKEEKNMKNKKKKDNNNNNSKDGGEAGEEKKFRAFTGKSRVLGGYSA